MASQSFGDIQAEMQRQMEAQNNPGGMDDAAQSMERAAKDLQSSTQNRNMQMQSLTQSVQQTQMQINSLISAIHTQQAQNRMSQSMSMTGPATAGPIEPAPPRGHGIDFSGVMRGVGNVGAFAGGVAYNYASGRVGDLRAGAGQMAYNATHHAGMGLTSTPGLVQMPNRGLMASGIGGLGLNYNPAAAQSYTYGAYQRGNQRNFGQNVGDYTRGAFSLGSSLLSFGSLGGVAGGILGTAVGGPIGGLAGQAVGAMIASPMDVLNPLAIAGDEAGRANFFGQNANIGAQNFLRGRRNEFGQVGQFGFRGQAQIGKSLQRATLRDLTFSNEDLGNAQQQFNELGLMLGVQSPEMYEREFKKRIGNLKDGMKIMQTTMEGQLDFMKTMFDDVGLNFGNEMSLMQTRIAAAGHLSGVSPQQMSQIAAQGARAAGQFGLMNPTGAMTAMSGRSLAGMAATAGDRGGVSTSLLASVGGESGLGQLIGSAQNRHLGGVGGHMMLLGGGSGNVFNQMGNVTDNIGGSSGAIGYLSNRHTMLDKMMKNNPQAAKIHMATMIGQVADQMEGSFPGASKKDLMKMAAKSLYNMNPIEADALVSSIQQMPGELKRSRMNQLQSIEDLQTDAYAEQYGLKGRMRRAFIGFAEATGAQGLSDSIVDTSADAATAAANYMERAQDKLYGIKRTPVTEKGVAGMLERGGIQKGEMGAMTKTSAVASKLADMRTYGGGSSEMIQRHLKEAIESGDTTKLMQAAGAINRSGRVESYGDLEYAGQYASPEDAYEAAKAGGATRDQLKKLRKGLGISGGGGKDMGGLTEEEVRGLGVGMFGFNESNATHRMSRVLGTREFEKIARLMERLSETKNYKSVGLSGQSEEHKQIFRELQAAVMEAMKGDNADMIREFLKNNGVTIGSDGRIDPEGMYEKVMQREGMGEFSKEGGLGRKHGDYTKMDRSVFRSKGGENMSSAINRLEKHQTYTAMREGMKSGFRMLDSELGGKTFSAIAVSGTGGDMATTFLSDLDRKVEGMSEDEIRGIRNKNIRSAALRLKRSSSTNYAEVMGGEDNIRHIMNSLMYMGASGMEGGASVTGSGAIDKEWIGGSIEAMRGLKDTNEQQVLLLQELVKEMRE